MVYDCRPPLLPVSLQLSGIGPLSGLPTVVSASVAVLPWEDGLTISGVGSDGLVVPELGVAPLEDSGTDLDDELPTLDGSPSTDAVKPGEVVIPKVGPVPREVDLELARALLEVGILPLMVTPIIDPVVESSVTPALYPVYPIPVMSASDQVPVLVASHLREVGGSPVLDQSRRTWCLLLAQCLSQSHPGSRHRYGQMMFPDRRPAWLRWTSTCCGILHCYWGTSLSCRPL